MELVGAGRMADVYAWSDGRVLRRYRDGGDTAAEAALMRHLAAHGYPVPAVHPGGQAAELVMDRLDGPTLSQAASAGTVTPAETGAILADLLQRLHGLPPQHSRTPGDRILHLDLHPENVILTAAGPMVIDWNTSIEGPPGLDRAMTALIVAQVAFAEPALGPAIRLALVPLLAAAPLDPAQLAVAATRRAADPGLTAAETTAIPAAVALLLNGVG